MKALRRLCMRGNALYICIPKEMAARLRWSVGDALAVEAIGPQAVRVRPADVTDLSSASVPPMNFDLPKASGA